MTTGSAADMAGLLDWRLLRGGAPTQAPGSRKVCKRNACHNAPATSHLCRMGRTADYSKETCSVAAALSVVGDPWTLLILRDAFEGVRRFDDWQERLGVARNVLAARLNGQGQVVQSRGFFQVATTCPACGGEGVRITDPCANCRGSGRVTQVAKLKVDVPPGVESGMWLQLRGQGEPGDPGAPRGNLRIQILVRKHPFFERNRNDLICQVPISFPQAALGADDRGADARRPRPPPRSQGDPERRHPQAQGPRHARHHRPRPRRRARRGRRRDAPAPHAPARKSCSASWPRSNTRTSAPGARASSRSSATTSPRTPTATEPDAS